MKKKTAKKHYSQLYKASTIQQTIYDDDADWNSLTYFYSGHIITVKKCKKYFSKKQLSRLLSDRKTIYKFCDDMNVSYPDINTIISCLKWDTYKDAKRFSIVLLNDIFAINHEG
jgi:hypothetical protein